jgi:hypothetical protein
MTTINVITPPDVLHNQALNILVVQPSEKIRLQIQSIIESFDKPINIYLYDPAVQEQRDVAWLLNIAKIVDYTILDLDNTTVIERNFASYLISLPNTFYLTNDETTPYNLLSVNKIYNLDWLKPKLNEE